MRAKHPTECAVFYPTYSSYKALAERASDREIVSMLHTYKTLLLKCTTADVRQCYRDAVRACEDEQLARQFETSEGGAE